MMKTRTKYYLMVESTNKQFLYRIKYNKLEWWYALGFKWNESLVQFTSLNVEPISYKQARKQFKIK